MNVDLPFEPHPPAAFPSNGAHRRHFAPASSLRFHSALSNLPILSNLANRRNSALGSNSFHKSSYLPHCREVTGNTKSDASPLLSTNYELFAKSSYLAHSNRLTKSVISFTFLQIRTLALFSPLGNPANLFLSCKSELLCKTGGRCCRSC